MKSYYYQLINGLASKRIKIGSKKIPILMMFVGFLFSLIPLLAWFQFQWLGQLSEGEKERLKTSLNYSATRMSEDFDTELSEPYQIFRKEFLENSNKNNFEKLADAFSKWISETHYPNLIKSVYFISRKKNEDKFSIQLLDSASKNLTAIEWPSYLKEIQSKISPQKPANGDFTFFAIQGLIVEEFPFIVISNIPSFSNSITDIGDIKKLNPSYTILELDKSVIANKLIPDLAKTYFIQNSVLDYDVGIYDSEHSKFLFKSDTLTANSAFQHVDIETSIANIKVQDFVFNSVFSPKTVFTETNIKDLGLPSNKNFSLRVLVSDSVKIKKRELPKSVGYSYSYSTLSTDEKNKTFSVSSGKKTSMQMIMITDHQSTQNFTPSPWLLGIKHHDGSLDQAVQNARIRNLLISFGVLILLTLSMLIIVVASNRSRELAHRQIEFVATVSHELRTPLAVIRSAAENLADGVVSSTDQSKNYGNLILNQGRRLSEMVEQVLEYAGIQSQNKSYSFMLTEPISFLESCIEEFHHLNGNQNIEIKKEIESFLPSFEIDRNGIKTALFNLFSNSIKYSGENKEISLKAFHRDHTVFIQVKDNGNGISETDLPHIFEPFFRGKEAADAQIKGSGLGLSLVKNIIDDHAGKISVESKIGLGTIFTLEIPVKRKQN